LYSARRSTGLNIDPDEWLPLSAKPDEWCNGTIICIATANGKVLRCRQKNREELVKEGKTDERKYDR
jgi:hypothetical protein